MLGGPAFCSSLEVDTGDEGGDYPPQAPHSAGFGGCSEAHVCSGITENENEGEMMLITVLASKTKPLPNWHLSYSKCGEVEKWACYTLGIIDQIDCLKRML